jgi:hypothetical protein
VIDYEIVVLDQEQFTSTMQIDVNVLLERRAAMVNTQSYRRSQTNWWIDKTSCD